VSAATANSTRRRWWKYLLFVTTFAFLTLLGLLIYINTDSFQALVRRKLVAEVERITGGRAEIASIHTIPFRLQAEVRGITVHGRESATDVPLAHVDHIVARLKIRSLLRSELAFNEVVLEQPIIHVAFYAGGSTNFPPRQRVAVSGATPVEQLFALSIDHFEIRRGQIFWDDQTIPLDFAARDTSLQMDYSFLHRRYDGRVLVGFVDTKLLNYRPFAWMTAMEFSLGSDSALVRSLKWNSGHSHLSGSGQVTDFRRPHLQASYDARLDLTELASIVRRRDLRTGLLELKGSGDWSLDKYAANGLLTLRDLAWRDDQIAFSKASLDAGYSLTDQQIKLSKIEGKIFGGNFTGDVEVNQWLAPSQHLTAAARRNLETAVISAARPPNRSRTRTAKSPPSSIQSALVLLHLRDLSAEELAAALNSPAHPLPQIRPVGSASGTLEARWQGTPRDAEVQFALNLTPPAHHGAGQTPITARATGVYHVSSDSLDLPQFTLSTPTSRVQAAGTLSSSSAVKLSVTTSSLTDWLPFIAVVRGPALVPVDLNGSATFNGNMSGAMSSPQLAGALVIDDFDVNLRPTARTSQLHSHWDSLSTSIQVSFRAIALRRAALQRDGTSVDFDASANLDHGHITGDSAFNVRANVHNAELADLQALSGFNYPISGKTDLFIQAGGTPNDPHGDGQVHVNNAIAYGETIQRFDSGFHLARGEIAFDNIHLFHDDSVVTGSAGYNPSSRAFHLDLAGNNFDLAHMRQLDTGHFSVEGRADFIVKGSGTPSAPSINADVHVRNLTLDHELEGELDLQAITQGSELHLTGNSRLQHGSLLLSGNVRMRDGYPSTFSVQMDQLDLDVLWSRYLRGQLTGHSAVTGSLELRGPLRVPRQWILDGTLTDLALEVDKVKVHNQDPIRFSLAHQALSLRDFHLVGEGSDLTAHGSVQLSGAHLIDITADGRIDLKLLSAFSPDFTSSGLVAMKLTVGGSLEEPFPQGSLQVSNGSVSYAGLPSGLSELNGSLLFTRNQMHIDKLTARTGGGTVDLKGDATFARQQQLNFNLTATGKDVRLRYPPGVSSTADGELHWVGSRSGSALSGDISINKIAVTPGFDFSAYLERSRQFNTVTPANSPLNSIKLDIRVQTAPELQMRTAIARLSGDADLRLRGSVARPAVLGRVDVLEGQATFHGTRFTLERGDITFANPVAIEPQLNLQASTHVRNYDLNITIIGTPDRLNLNYRSEPPLPKSDIIALLALGRTNEESAQLQEQSGQSVFSDQATALILSQALNTTVSNRLQRLFGASNIKIDPQGLTTETNPTARGPQVTIEQEFANNISLTYSTNVSQSSQQIIQGEYYVNRNVSVVGTRDQNGVVSFDLRIRRRRK
jgi:translocation and assembly module TamB